MGQLKLYATKTQKRVVPPVGGKLCECEVHPPPKPFSISPDLKPSQGSPATYNPVSTSSTQRLEQHACLPGVVCEFDKFEKTNNILSVVCKTLLVWHWSDLLCHQSTSKHREDRHSAAPCLRYWVFSIAMYPSIDRIVCLTFTDQGKPYVANRVNNLSKLIHGASNTQYHMID